MKRLLIAVALLTLTAVLCVGTHVFLEQATAQMLHTLDTANAALTRGDLDAADEAVQTFCHDFEQKNRVLPLFFPHEKMDAIEESAAQLSSLTQQNTAHLAEELAQCRYHVQHLRQSERLTLTNIF